MTSWNWLYLTDYSASYKPAYVPEDNPADFSYFFDNSGRRTCYLAPERFLTAGASDEGRGITWAMDVFSAGCVIAELFTETPIFNLSQLFRYRKGEYDPDLAYMGKINDEDIREMVSHMIQLQPESRYSADEYLKFWKKKAFPDYFYSFLHQYMGSITDPSSGLSSIHPETSNFGDADERIERIFNDFDKISFSLNQNNNPGRTQTQLGPSAPSDEIIPVQVDIPDHKHQATSEVRFDVDDGSLIFLTLVVSSLRHTARASARIRACDLMLAFAERVTDEAKLDRVLPYVVALLGDRADGVRIAALRTMTQVLALVKTVTPVNANAFTEYIKPRLPHFTGGPGPLKVSTLARATYASCIASLAHSSLRMLDMAQALRAEGSLPRTEKDADEEGGSELAFRDTYDHTKAELLDTFEEHTKALLVDTSSSVRRALLGSVASLCVFFGTHRANEVVLTYLNTYLNGTDWILKCAFFRTIVGVAAFVGGPSLEDFILPLMIPALVDTEDFVVQQVMSSFANMAELGLLQRTTTWEMIDIATRYSMHPDYWVREAAIHFVSASTRYISVADRHCIVAPLLKPYLKSSIREFSEHAILDALKKPLPSAILDMALHWAAKSSNSTFWKPNKSHRSFSLASPALAVPIISSKDLKSNALSECAKNAEDEGWIKRLRGIGMTSDDEMKLVALKGYIWRLASERTQSAKSSGTSALDSVMPLKNLKVTPLTVFFEKEKRSPPRQRRADRSVERPSSKRRQMKGQNHTITDALLDASTSIEDPLAQRKRSYANARKERMSSLQDDKSRQGIEDSPGKDHSDPVSPPHHDHSNARGMPRGTGDEDGSRTNAEESDGSTRPTEVVRARSSIRHKSSAINLLNRRDTAKTPAKTGTDIANATGRIQGPLHGENAEFVMTADANTHDTEAEPSSPADGGHSYEGNDPSVLKLLDSLASDYYPRDIIDFGPMVTPARKHHSMKRADATNQEQSWRPQGVLIATFGEHTRRISRVVPSPDHAFFISGSEDGTVRVWDTFRLEKNLAHRSRQIFTHHDGAAITALCFVENTHTFISAASDGTIKAVKIDYSLEKETPKYGRQRIMRNYQLPSPEYAVWLEHTKTENASVLFMATNTSRIIALDLKNMTELYVLLNPLHHGTPTCFCTDHSQAWLVVGTSHGILDLWDLRFHLRVKAWGIVGGMPIHRLSPSPFHPQGAKVCLTGGTGQSDLTIWDLESGACLEIFRGGITRSSSKENLRLYEAIRIDDEKPEGMLGRYAASTDPLQNNLERQDQGFRSFATYSDSLDERRANIKTGFFLIGGTDRRLRCWDLHSATGSKVISGLDAEESQPKYATTHPTTTLTMHTERLTQSGSQQLDTPGKVKRTTGKQPRNSVISLQQQSLLRSHLDEITDVCVLEAPIGMTVSADRMGCIYVFQ